ncbi:Rieske (2Fe-2S) protein [Pararhodobacter zhoushanensis]|uniref:Rieske (2Fe-2S) protein n=1 Tax=Pararhodobacter zhoushanensis TaxID=2479545 RepID=UPI000F8C8FB8|nr:Rieske 2Fe-2S domain-containing protein [Pararhodobacter zhoushanensis]
MTDHVVCRLDEVPAGASKRVSINGRAIAIFNVAGTLSAIGDRCPHEGASLCLGRVTGVVRADGPGNYRLEREGELVRCPWHGWEFDLKTGKSYCDPTRLKVRTFDVQVKPGETLAEGPYTIDVFDVAVRDDYVVVSL